MMEKNNPRKRHIGIFVIPTLVIAALLIITPAIILIVVSRMSDEQIKLEIERSSLFMQHTIRSFMDGAYSLTQELASNPSILTMDTAIQTPILQQSVARNHYLELLYIQGMDGMQTARSQNVLAHRAERWWFQQVERDRVPFVSASYLSIATNMPTASIFFPMFDNYEMIGIFGADIRLDYIQRLIKQFTEAGVGKYSFIIDGNGVVLAHPDSTILANLPNFSARTQQIPRLDSGGNPIWESGNIVTDEAYLAVPDDLVTVVNRVMAGYNGVYIINMGSTVYYVSYEPICMPGYSDTWSVITLQSRTLAMGAVHELVIITVLITVLIFIAYSLCIYMLRNSLKKSNEALDLQMTMMSTLFDSIPDHIFAKDLNLNYLYVNQSALEYFGCQYEEVIGKTDYDNGLRFPKEMADFFANQDRDIINNGKINISEVIIPSAKGIPNNYELVKQPLVLNGAIIGVLGTSRNITVRKETERLTAKKYEYTNKLNTLLSEITKSPAIFEGDLKSAADYITKIACEALNVHGAGIWAYEEENHVLAPVSYYSASAGAHVEKTAIDLTSHPGYMTFIREERIIALYDVEDCKVINYYSDGRVLCASLDAPVRVDGKIVSMLCVEQLCDENVAGSRDWMTEEENFTSSLADLLALAISGEEKRRAREDAEIANHAKSSFLANMSHEIRTPMNAIIGVTEILMHDETQNVKEGLEKIYTSCDMLLCIINEILDFSKIEAGKLEIVPINYEIASTINDTICLNIIRVEDKPIEFELIIDETMPAAFNGDELRIKQILNNLLSNAFKYTNSGKVKLSVSAEPAPEREDSVMLVLRVEDTGCGITKEQQETLFDEYTRFNLTQHVGTQGTGLGLAITSRLVQLMEGEILVESIADKGSVFTVRLPQKPVGTQVLGTSLAQNLQSLNFESALPHKRRSYVEREIMPYGKVLIVDDVETNLYVAKGLMKFYRFEMETAASGPEVIKKISEGCVYDVIFMDHMMPGMDGMETMKKLREMNYTHPIIALTANAVSGQSDIFLENGFDGFISKPIDIRQLNMILNMYVRDKQPPEVIEAARALTAAESGQTNETKTTPKTLFTGKAIDGMDIDKGLARYEGNEEVYLKILQAYLHSMRAMLASLETVDTANLIDYKIKVHGVSGASFDIFATDIGAAAKALEKAAIAEDLDYITTHNPPFLTLLRKLLDDMDAVLAAINADKPQEALPIKDKPDAELIEALINACKLYDLTTVDDIVTEIEKYSYTSDPGLAAWLRETADTMEFSLIIDRLEA